MADASGGRGLAPPSSSTAARRPSRRLRIASRLEREGQRLLPRLKHVPKAGHRTERHGREQTDLAHAQCEDLRSEIEEQQYREHSDGVDHGHQPCPEGRVDRLDPAQAPGVVAQGVQFDATGSCHPDQAQGAGAAGQKRRMIPVGPGPQFAERHTAGKEAARQRVEVSRTIAATTRVIGAETASVSATVDGQAGWLEPARRRCSKKPMMEKFSSVVRSLRTSPGRSASAYDRRADR